MSLFPLQHTSTIALEDANAALIRWDHAMGPCERPNGEVWAHGLFIGDELAAVTVTASLIRPASVAGMTRANAIELARLCAGPPHLNRVMLRLWREVVHPAFAASRGTVWALSYQDRRLHRGDTYRFDGWIQLGRSRSGTDGRSGKKGRDKTVWGWHADAAVRAAKVEQLRAERERGGASCDEPQMPMKERLQCPM